MQKGQPLKLRRIIERVKAKLVKANDEPILRNVLYDTIGDKIVGGLSCMNKKRLLGKG